MITGTTKGIVWLHACIGLRTVLHAQTYNIADYFPWRRTALDLEDVTTTLTGDNDALPGRCWGRAPDGGRSPMWEGEDRARRA